MRMVPRMLANLVEIIRRAFQAHPELSQFVGLIRATHPKRLLGVGKIALVAENRQPRHHLALPATLAAFQGLQKFVPVSFRVEPIPRKSAFGPIFAFFLRQLHILRKSGPEAIYHALGVRRHFRPPPVSAAREESVSASAERVLSNTHSLADMERLELRGVLVGDLIYDQYLVETESVGLNLEDPAVLDVVKRAIRILDYFLDIFDQNSVAAVFGDAAYLNAIPCRIALSRGIPAFETGLHPQRISVPQLDGVFQGEFPTVFREIPHSIRSEGVAVARNYLEKFVAGDRVAPLFGHSFKSFEQTDAFGLEQAIPGQTTVLVAPHNPLTDSPHAATGRLLFPDYAQWMDEIGRLSNLHDYRWLIKVHPDKRSMDVYEKNREWVQSLTQLYPRLTLLPESISHAEVISSGVSAVLTVSGSIGFEYAMRGIPVINASPDGPHGAYRFNFSPGNVDDYRELIASIPSLAANPDREEVAEYFFMAMYYSRESPFISDLNAKAEVLGGPFAWDSSRLYEFFVAEFEPAIHAEAIASVQSFQQSGRRRWYPHLYDSELAL